MIATFAVTIGTLGVMVFVLFVVGGEGNRMVDEEGLLAANQEHQLRFDVFHQRRTLEKIA